MALTDNLDAYYAFEADAGTNLFDKSPNPNTLVINGGVANIFHPDGKLDGCFDFAGSTSEYLEVATLGHLDYTGSRTIAGWVRLNTTTGLPMVVVSTINGSAGGYNWDIRIIDNAGSPQFEFRIYFDTGGTDSATVRDGTVLSAGTWYFVQCSFDAGTQDMKIRVDEGTTVTTNTGKPANTNTASSNSKARFCLNGANTQPLNGRLDEFALWTRAVDFSEFTPAILNATERVTSPLVSTVTSAVNPAGGGDYTSLAAWESGRQAAGSDLSAGNRAEIAELYAGNAGAGTTIEGWICDSEANLRIQVAAGNRHDGTFATGVAQINPSGTGFGIDIQEKYVEVRDVFFDNTGSGASLSLTSTARGCVIERCLNRGGSRFVHVASSNPATTKNTHRVQNCISIGTDLNAIRNDSSTTTTVEVLNCTLMIDGAGEALLRTTQANATITEDNNYLALTASATKIYDSTTGTINRGTSTATSNTEAATAGLRNIPYSAATFVSVTAPEDLHLTGSSGLLAKATKLTSKLTDDIDAVARPDAANAAEWDIGADQRTAPLAPYVPPEETALPMRGYRGISLKTGRAPDRFTVQPAQFPKRTPRGGAHLLDWIGGGD